MSYFLTILIISFSLGIDAFSLALAFGICHPNCHRASKVRISVSFGFFQFIMPIIGYWIGSSIASVVDKYDHWIIFSALSLIGIKMILESSQSKEKTCKPVDISKGLPLVFASLATSIDALAVGFSFALLRYPVAWSSLIIGGIAFLMTYAGVYLGSKIGNRFFTKPEWIGGIVLILLGIKFLFDGLGVL